jgi:hypothetical protein
MASRRATAPIPYSTWSSSDAHPAAPKFVAVSQLKAITRRNSKPTITAKNRKRPTKAAATGNLAGGVVAAAAGGTTGVPLTVRARLQWGHIVERFAK